MTARTKDATKMYLSSPMKPGCRVSKKDWAKYSHLPDEKLLARGIPARMLRRMRKRDA